MSVPISKMLLTPEEAAKSLSISPRSLWGLMKSGEIPSVKIGRSVRYPVADLERWIEARKTAAQPAGE